MRVISSTGWTLESSIAPCTMPGAATGAVGASERNSVLPSASELHRVGRPHHADLAELAVLAGDRAVAGDG